MKTIFKKLYVLAAGSLLLCSGACNEEDFLDRSPKASPSPDNFFVNASSARLAVNACYHAWQFSSASMLNRDMTILLDAMTDDSYWRTNRSGSIALEKWDINPTHENVTSWWSHPYECINAANFAIENIPLSSDANFTEEQQRPFIAEAYFFRAFSYLFLTSFYGDVPLYTGIASDPSEYSVAVSPKAEIMAQIFADFQFAKENLPESQNTKGAPTKASAAAFLAKAYLFAKDWANAETAAREALQIAEGSGYMLMDDYLSIWSDEGNPELLFYWSYVNNDENFGQNMTVQRLCRDAPPTLRNAVNGDGWGYSLPQRDLYDAFEDGDPRRGYTLFAPGDDWAVYPGPDDFDYTHETLDDMGNAVTWDVTYSAGDTIMYDYRWSPTGLNVRKMIKSVKDVANVRWDGLDIPVMRMSELYLILAEALAEQGKGEALTWVNRVRSRPSVNMPDKTAADGSLVDIVRHERRVELAMEGLRIFDLLRWGTLSEAFADGKKVKRNFFSDYLDESSSLKYDTPELGNLTANPIFPIPQTEVDQNTEINN